MEKKKGERMATLPWPLAFDSMAVMTLILQKVPHMLILLIRYSEWNDTQIEISQMNHTFVDGPQLIMMSRHTGNRCPSAGKPGIFI
jgi:hypothetical protein